MQAASAPCKRRQQARPPAVAVVPIDSVRPSPENDSLYRPIDRTDPEIVALSDSIQRHGILEPLVVTLDGWILSGHRRHAAAILAGLTQIPVRIEPIRRGDDADAFLVRLREHNRQREKSRDERIREELLSVDPEEAYASLVEFRRRSSEVATPAMKIGGVKQRKAISGAKAPFLAAIRRVLDDRREYWPLSDRQIHYALLNDPPLIHASKPASTYKNDRQSYQSLVELLTRARVAGLIPMNAIADETRPVTTWQIHRGVSAFVRDQADSFLKGYWRDLLQSQPNHIELVVEKNATASIVRRVAERFCLPMTSGRGYCSLPPRHAMVERFRASGKTKLVILLVTDFDPDGEEIAHSLARSIRDDFDVERIHAVKVALTFDQVRRFGLPPSMQAKATSSHFEKFTSRYGHDVFELEALPPEQLIAVIEEAVDQVIDVEAFNAEVAAEREDAAELERVRRRAVGLLGDFNATTN